MFSSKIKNLFSNRLSNLFKKYEKREETKTVRGGQETKDTAGERGWYRKSDINLRALTKWSCALKLLDSCRTSFPLWLAVWRLTGGRHPASNHTFLLVLNHQLPTSSSSSTTALRDNIITFVSVIRNIKVSVISQHGNYKKQHTRVQSQPKQEHNSYNLITLHGETFLNFFEMMAKYITDLMSKYLLSRNVSRKKTHQATQQWFPSEHYWLPQRRPDRDEGSRRLIDFSAASKWWFLVQAQLSFTEGLLSPDTCSGMNTTGPPASIPPLWNQNELLWSLNET